MCFLFLQARMISFMLYDLTPKKKLYFAHLPMPLQSIWGKYQSGSYIFSTNFWLRCLHIWHLKHMDHSLINIPGYHHFEHLSENLSKNWLQFSICQECDQDIWCAGRPSKWHLNSLFLSVPSFYPCPELAHEKNNRSGLYYSSSSQQCFWWN